MDDIQECIRVIPETGQFIRVDFPSFVEADLNKKGDGMKTYVVELSYYKQRHTSDLEVTVDATNEAEARSKALNYAYSQDVCKFNDGVDVFQVILDRSGYKCWKYYPDPYQGRPPSKLMGEWKEVI